MTRRSESMVGLVGLAGGAVPVGQGSGICQARHRAYPTTRSTTRLRGSVFQHPAAVRELQEPS